MSDETGVTGEVVRVLRVHWLLPTEAPYGGGVPVSNRRCSCGRTLSPQHFEWRHYEEHRAHVADKLAKAGLLRPQDAAQAPQDGANGGDVGSGRGEGVSTPQRGAQAPGEEGA